MSVPGGREGEDEGTPPPVETVRLFVAVWPPPHVAATLASLEWPTVDAVRWSTPEQWHVTLGFLGSLESARVDAVGAALIAATSRAAGPSHVHLGPSSHRFGGSVLCVPVHGLDELAGSVRHELATVLPKAGLDRPFHGHLTLARSRGRRAIPQTLVGQPIEADWEVDEIALVRSDLLPSGAQYTTLVTATVPS